MADIAQQSRAQRAASQSFKSVTCPFCSLLCDDLEVRNDLGKLQVVANSCPRAAAGFERQHVSAVPHVDGKAVSLDKALDAAATLLRQAKQPLIGGLATDVAGMRALMDLAERTGSLVDHMHGDAMARNILAFQNRGWMMTTLTEIRNRADLIVFANLDAVSDHPRFFERYVWNRESMFNLPTAQREIIYLGNGLDTRAGVNPNGRKPWHLENDPKHLGELFAAARTLFAGNSLQVKEVAGVKIRDVAKFIEKLKAAKYGVIIWSPPRLPFPNADLTVESICDLVKDLNAVTRCSGFALGGNDSVLTASAVCAWQSGYPFRVNFAHGYAEYDPVANAASIRLPQGDIDALLWVTCFNPNAMPPATAAPTVLLAPPLQRVPAPCAVYIPVATPGVDHEGQMCRVDNVVSLPLHKVRHSALPTVASIGQGLIERL